MKFLRVLILSSLAFMTFASVVWAEDMRITLLGTGTPVLNNFGQQFTFSQSCSWESSGDCLLPAVHYVTGETIQRRLLGSRWRKLA